MDGGLPPMAAVLGPPLAALGVTDGSLPADWGIRLPIGISFFTFQAVSYVIDVYHGEAEIQRNPLHFGVYIALFPQLIAGPIVRDRLRLAPSPVVRVGVEPGAPRWVVHGVRVRTTPSIREIR